uniref:Uncharacterized protein n=1 Tax=Neospora caninum (strain Liverpool) TaxID=572307 RepID=A0A0F7ULX6_NEOCL|nr:TPA: hypothetical protein BN1204_049275 [Neospora caninum Liverpool]
MQILCVLSLHEFEPGEQLDQGLSRERKPTSPGNFPSTFRGNSRTSTSFLFDQRRSSEVIECPLWFRVASPGGSGGPAVCGSWPSDNSTEPRSLLLYSLSSNHLVSSGSVVPLKMQPARKTSGKEHRDGERLEPISERENDCGECFSSSEDGTITAADFAVETPSDCNPPSGILSESVCLGGVVLPPSPLVYPTVSRPIQAVGGGASSEVLTSQRFMWAYAASPVHEGVGRSASLIQEKGNKMVIASPSSALDHGDESCKGAKRQQEDEGRSATLACQTTSLLSEGLHVSEAFSSPLESGSIGYTLFSEQGAEGLPASPACCSVNAQRVSALSESDVSSCWTSACNRLVQKRNPAAGSMDVESDGDQEVSMEEKHDHTVLSSHFHYTCMTKLEEMSSCRRQVWSSARPIDHRSASPLMPIEFYSSTVSIPTNDVARIEEGEDNDQTNRDQYHTRPTPKDADGGKRLSWGSDRTVGWRAPALNRNSGEDRIRKRRGENEGGGERFLFSCQSGERGKVAEHDIERCGSEQIERYCWHEDRGNLGGVTATYSSRESHLEVGERGDLCGRFLKDDVEPARESVRKEDLTAECVVIRGETKGVPPSSICSYSEEGGNLPDRRIFSSSPSLTAAMPGQEPHQGSPMTVSLHPLFEGGTEEEGVAALSVTASAVRARNGNVLGREGGSHKDDDLPRDQEVPGKATPFMGHTPGRRSLSVSNSLQMNKEEEETPELRCSFGVPSSTLQLETPNTNEYAGTEKTADRAISDSLGASDETPTPKAGGQCCARPSLCSVSPAAARSADYEERNEPEERTDEGSREDSCSKEETFPSVMRDRDGNITLSSSGGLEYSRTDERGLVTVIESLPSHQYRPPTPPQRPKGSTSCSRSLDLGSSSCLLGRHHESPSSPAAPERRLLLLPGIRPRTERGSLWGMGTNTTPPAYPFGSPLSSMLSEDDTSSGIISVVESLATGEGGAPGWRSTLHLRNCVQKSEEEEESDVSEECTEDEELHPRIPSVGDLQDALQNDESFIRSGHKRRTPFPSCSSSSVSLRKSSQKHAGRNGCFYGRHTSDECHMSNSLLRESRPSSARSSSQRERSRSGSVTRRRRRRLLGSHHDRRSSSSALSVAKPSEKKARERAVKFSTTLCQVYVYEASPCTAASADRTTDGGTNRRLAEEQAQDVNGAEGKESGQDEKHLSLGSQCSTGGGEPASRERGHNERAQ